MVSTKLKLNSVHRLGSITLNVQFVLQQTYRNLQKKRFFLHLIKGISLPCFLEVGLLFRVLPKLLDTVNHLSKFRVTF